MLEDVILMFSVVAAVVVPTVLVAAAIGRWLAPERGGLAVAAAGLAAPSCFVLIVLLKERLRGAGYDASMDLGLLLPMAVSMLPVTLPIAFLTIRLLAKQKR